MSDKQKKTPIKAASRFTVPPRVIAGALILFVMFIAGGGVYDLVNKPQAVAQNPYTGAGSAIGFYGEQTITETLISMITLGLTFGGLYLANRATQIPYDRSRANTTLIIGVACAITGLILNYYILYVRNYVNSG